MSAPAYTVRLGAFEGPLDLLLHLVRTNELDIYNLPIAEITDQYLAYIAMFEELSLDVAGEYLVMAASLMYMKSRLLLPREEDEEDEEDEGVADLVRQLAEYQRYREAAEELRDRALLDRDVFRRPPTPPEGPSPEPAELRRLELADLFEALRRVLVRAAARRPHIVQGEEYSVADAVRSMVQRLKEAGALEFTDLFAEHIPRGLLISTFLGLLELIKLGVIAAEQEGRCGPIQLRLLGNNIDDTIGRLDEMYGAPSTGDLGDDPGRGRQEEDEDGDDKSPAIERS